MKLHVNWGHASAQQLKSVLMDAGGGAQKQLGRVDELVQQCEVCRASDRIPHLPTAGTPSALSFNEKFPVDLLFLVDTIVLHAMDTYSQYSHLVLARRKNPPRARDAFFSSWIAVFGRPRCIQMDEGRGRKNEIRTNFRAERRIKLGFQGKGATLGSWSEERSLVGEPTTARRRTIGSQASEISMKPSTV